MADWKRLARELILIDGRIDAAETAVIRQALLEDAFLDREEFQFLFELRREARAYCREFNQLFLQALKAILLADNALDAREVEWLRTFLLGGRVGEDEKQFLTELKAEAERLDPSFADLYSECMAR